MNKREVFNHYAAIIDNILEKSPFFKAYFQEPYCLDCGMENILMGVNFNIGATRACFVDNNYDYVVKMDISEDYYGSACEREEYFYKDAVINGFEQYFAEVEYLGTYTRTYDFYPFSRLEHTLDWYDPEMFEESFKENEKNLGETCPITISIPLYGYRKASHYWLPFYETNSEEVSIANNTPSALTSRDIGVAVAFIQEFGAEEYIRFSEFSEEHHINDIHSNNIGTIDGHFCLIDYAGYHSSDDYSL